MIVPIQYQYGVSAMYRYLLFTFIVLTIGLVSCSEDPAPTEPERDDEQEEPHTNPAFAYIGFGYDLTTNWADQNGKRGIVFDADILPASFTETSALEQSSYEQVTAASVDEYEQQMSAGFSASGRYKFFSGAVRANFKETEYRLSGRSFTTIQYYVEKARTDVISNYATVDHLRPYMDSTARADLENPQVSPEEIFRMYGTHVMTGAVLGARLDFSASMETSKILEGSRLDLMAQAAYKSMLGSAQLTGEFANETQKQHFLQNSTTSIHAYGGKSEYALDVRDIATFGQWRETIDANRVWMKFTPAGLIPIWEFCINPARSEQIENALPAWIKATEIKVDPLPEPPGECIVDILTTNADDAPVISRNGLTYYKLDANLNAGVTGKVDYCYLYCAFGLDTISTGNYTPITDLHLGLHTSAAAARADAAAGGYTPIGVDLNVGASGAYLYLAVKREKGMLPVRGLQVYNRTVGLTIYSRNAKTTGYFDVPSRVGRLDLNRGAGGHTIFLLYTKD